MPFSIKRQFVPATNEAAIRALEAQIGYPLPSSYRDFLLRFNGGEPTNTLFETSGDQPYAGSSIRYFFSICEQSTFSLAHKYAVYSSAGRIDKRMLPIAGDSGGNLVLLALAGSSQGQVFFWDHDLEGLVEPSDSPEHLAHLADSFLSFCDLLRPST